MVLAFQGLRKYSKALRVKCSCLAHSRCPVGVAVATSGCLTPKSTRSAPVPGRVASGWQPAQSMVLFPDGSGALCLVTRHCRVGPGLDAACCSPVSLPIGKMAVPGLRQALPGSRRPWSASESSSRAVLRALNASPGKSESPSHLSGEEVTGDGEQGLGKVVPRSHHLH